MFETTNDVWLDLLSNCLYEKSHCRLGPMQHYVMLRNFEGCKIVIYRRSEKPLGIFDCPNMIDMPKVKLGDSLINDLQLIAEWFCNKVDKCFKVDVTYQGNNVAFIESDMLPKEE